MHINTYLYMCIWPCFDQLPLTIQKLSVLSCTKRGIPSFLHPLLKSGCMMATSQYCITANIHVQESFTNFATIVRFAKFSCSWTFKPPLSQNLRDFPVAKLSMGHFPVIQYALILSQKGAVNVSFCNPHSIQYAYMTRIKGRFKHV